MNKELETKIQQMAEKVFDEHKGPASENESNYLNGRYNGIIEGFKDADAVEFAEWISSHPEYYFIDNITKHNLWGSVNNFEFEVTTEELYLKYLNREK